MKRTNNKVSGILAGVSGEYFVAAELSRRGFVASVTLKNTKGIDILVSNEDTTKFIGIQVKTNQEKRLKWILNEKAENFYDDNLYYVFVDLISKEQLPDFHIVPSKTVAQSIKHDYKNWLETLGKKRQKHNPTKMRMFKDEKEEFKGRWDLLNKSLKT